MTYVRVECYVRDTEITRLADSPWPGSYHVHFKQWSKGERITGFARTEDLARILFPSNDD